MTDSDSSVQMTDLDGQQVESLGRAALTAQLVGDGLEVARPERDAGIDLLAFTIEKPWKVMPIQMKAATGGVFSVHRKYEHIERLVMVYVWGARSAENVQFYAMTWRDAEKIAVSLNWTTKRSWTREDRYAGYGTTRPPARVRNAIAPYRMKRGKWSDLLDGLGE